MANGKVCSALDGAVCDGACGIVCEFLATRIGGLCVCVCGVEGADSMKSSANEVEIDPRLNDFRRRGAQ